MKTKLLFIFFLLLVITTTNATDNKNNYLRKVLNNLEKIESAIYLKHVESWEPGDTIPVVVGSSFIKEFNNPQDSTIGASFLSFDCNDTTKLKFCYDGTVRAMIDDESKDVIIDNFTARKLPFRPITPPFFNNTKNIIKYALTSKDSITTELKDCGDHYYFKLIIHEDKQVEFFGEAHYMPEPPFAAGDPTSIYELWISKTTDLPYKTRREMSHNISVAICSDVILNTLSIAGFSAYNYLPANYEIRKYGDKNKTKTVSPADLTDKNAPGWVLNDINEQPVSLADFKSKVLLINFTGIGCGACLAAVPFLKKLKEQFNNEDFELVAIESWGRKIHSLQNYANKYELNYIFLEGKDEISKQYLARAAPVFFILDKQRVIRKVIMGYSQSVTDEKIVNAIKELL